MKDRKINFAKAIIIIFGIIIATICVLFWKSQDEKQNISNVENSVELQEEKQEEQEKEETSLSLIMVGDYLIHSSIYKDASRNTGNNGYDFKPMITHIKENVKSYDLAYYNQETILGGSELGVSDYPNFNSPYEAGDAMIDAGFNLVSLATNHTMDSGAKAVINSRKYWDRKESAFAVRKL